MVPVCMERSHEAWVAILGVMFSGATAIPIDVSQPSVSPDVLARDAELRHAVANPSSQWAKRLGVEVVSPDLSPQRNAPPLPEVSCEDPAYVVYTSGTTGTPKGVVVSHQAIANTLRWRSKDVPLTEKDRVLILLSHQFDASMAIVLSTIHQGATPRWMGEGPFDLERLMDQLRTERITVLPAVPSLLKTIVSHKRFPSLLALEQIWCGGEALGHELVKEIRRAFDGPIYNFYGPTEAAVEATSIRIDGIPDPSRPIPIGFPIDGCDVCIVDENGLPQPKGAIGQIAITGAGLSEGYLNRPDLTARQFVESEEIRDRLGQKVRLYLTGDLGRITREGSIEFIGRADHQVKIAGYRLELQEIEQTIERHPGVRRAACTVRGNGNTKRLVAFVQLSFGTELSSVNRFVKDSLAPYKQPAEVIEIERIPENASGKIQRNELPIGPSIGTNRQSEPPSTALERFLADYFARHLEIDSIGIDDNFFELGGTSLAAATLASELSAELSLEIPSSLLLEHGEIGSLADRLCGLHEEELRTRFGNESVERTNESAADALDSLLVRLKTTNEANSVFMIHPPGGIVLCYREIAKHCSDRQNVTAIRSRGLFGAEALPESLPEMCGDYADQICNETPTESIFLGGWSLGGVIAFEVSKQLLQRGRKLGGLVLLDSTVPPRSDPVHRSSGAEYGLDMSLDQLANLDAEHQLPFLYEHARRIGVLNESAPTEVVQRMISELRRLFAHHVKLCQVYELTRLPIPILLLRPKETASDPDTRRDRGWSAWSTKDVNVEYISGHHHSMVQPPGAREIAQQIDRFIGKHQKN